MKFRIPLIISLVAGIVIMAFSYLALNKQVKSATTTIDIIVPRSNIEAYSVISSSNLTIKAVPPSIIDKNTARSPDQIANKICTSPLYAGKPIDTRTIAQKPDDIGSKQVIGVYIDAARCAGVTEGDIVDVYRVGEAAQGEAAAKIAGNSRVIRITDEKGVAIRSTILQEVSGEVGVAVNPRIVYLLVNPLEVPYVIQGAVDKSKSLIALSKKSKESLGVIEPEAENAQEGGAKTND